MIKKAEVLEVMKLLDDYRLHGLKPYLGGSFAMNLALGRKQKAKDVDFFFPGGRNACTYTTHKVLELIFDEVEQVEHTDKGPIYKIPNQWKLFKCKKERLNTTLYS